VVKGVSLRSLSASVYWRSAGAAAREGEIWITNEWVNESWQSGLDDLRKPCLAERRSTPFIFIQSESAAPHGIESGDHVEGFNEMLPISGAATRTASRTRT
jgi:arsenite oxidase large subunit